MKIYTTICKVGELITEGEGNGKKIARKRAAENMMNELKKLEFNEVSTETNRAKQWFDTDKQKRKLNVSQLFCKKHL